MTTKNKIRPIDYVLAAIVFGLFCVVGSMDYDDKVKAERHKDQARMGVEVGK